MSVSDEFKKISTRELEKMIAKVVGERVGAELSCSIGQVKITMHGMEMDVRLKGDVDMFDPDPDPAQV